MMSIIYPENDRRVDRLYFFDERREQALFAPQLVKVRLDFRPVVLSETHLVGYPLLLKKKLISN